MRTTLDLDETLIAELMKVTKAKTEAIHLAMTDLIHRKKIEHLKALSGTMPLTYVRPALRDAEQGRTKRRRT
jgi:Arc/MetJ family transcription regulator